MNLVEAVNKMLGTDANNLQGALNETAGIDASNVTEAISKIEGGGASFANVTFISSAGEYSVQKLITADNAGFPVAEDIVVTAAEPVTFSVLLGSGGKTRIYAGQFNGIAAEMPTVTGDIVFGGSYFEISGNGTITAKGFTT